MSCVKIGGIFSGKRNIAGLRSCEAFTSIFNPVHGYPSFSPEVMGKLASHALEDLVKDHSMELDHEDVQLSARLEFPAVGLGASMCTGMISLSAPPAAAQRTPITLALALDISGSMSLMCQPGVSTVNKLDLCKNTVKFLIQQLRDDDTVSLVTFHAAADTVFEMTPATPENREAICKAVESITHQSGTNLSGGLLSAVSQLASNVVSTTASSVKSVFLFTDGEPTHGFLKQATLMPVLEDALKISSTFGANLKVNTFGFGASHNSELLQAIAQSSHGTYYFIDSPEVIGQTFADSLGGLMSVCAQNIELRITPASAGVAIEQAHTPFATRTEGNATVISLPDLFSEERKDILFDFSLPQVDAPVAGLPAFELTASFIDILRLAPGSSAAGLAIDRVATTPVDMRGDADIAVHRARVATASNVQEATQLANTNQHRRAAELLSGWAAHVKDMIAAESGAGAAQRRAALQHLRNDVQHCEQEVQRKASWQTMGRHLSQNVIATHSSQRSQGVGGVRQGMQDMVVGAHLRALPAPMTSRTATLSNPYRNTMQSHLVDETMTSNTEYMESSTVPGW